MARKPIESPLDPAVEALLGRAITELDALGFQAKLTPPSKHESVVWDRDYFWYLTFACPFMEGHFVLHTAAMHYEVFAFCFDKFDTRFKPAPGEQEWWNQVGMFTDMQQLEGHLLAFLDALRAAVKSQFVGASARTDPHSGQGDSGERPCRS